MASPVGEPVVAPTKTAGSVIVRNLRMSFGQHEVLRGLDLTVDPGEVLAIIGPSGSGKSTAIRCLNLLETPTAGEISIGGQLVFGPGTAPKGKQLAALRRQVGMVFQSFNLFPTLSAEQNISLAQVHSLGRSRDAARQRSLELLDRVGLADRCDQRSGQLSGGQQQRVAIARALALDPAVMLFDEPTSAIDPELRREVLAVMRDVANSGMTMLVVTHELRFAEKVADRVAFFAEGSILEDGNASEFFGNPRHARTRQFLAAVEGDLDS